MDRIYYCKLTKDGIIYSKENREMPPIFCRQTEGYEVYYLQVRPDTERSELRTVYTHLKKGIERLSHRYQEHGAYAYLVLEASFIRWLENRQQAEYWQKLWDIPLYSEYREPHNLMLLLKNIFARYRPRQLIILGEAPGFGKWIPGLARYMRGITIYSPTKPKDWEPVRENLLEEYGLIIKWEKEMKPEASEPALVLDYWEKETVFIWGIPAGSIWVDMNSMEMRRHALEDRETGIIYTSLKSFWREEMIQTLDTMDKIQYNTEVKLEGK